MTAAVTIRSLQIMKEKKEPITMVTAYDFPTARVLEDAGVDVVLVGDSVGNVVLGYENTLPVTMDDMVHHTKAVSRGIRRTFLIGDMPFMATQGSVEQSVYNAGRFIREGGAHAVKIEGAACLPAIKQIIEIGIPVMGHLGFTPQSVHQLGGPRVQGKDSHAAEKLLADASRLEAAGVFSLVLELVPADLAQKISTTLKIPVIGIGAGPACDGQVLVYHDLVGLTEGASPKFVKRYAALGDAARAAVRNFVTDVRDHRFPSPAP